MITKSQILLYKHKLNTLYYFMESRADQFKSIDF